MSTLDQANQTDLSADSPATPSGDVSKADYKVGYKRPPVGTRFPPGKSGNPKGRPKGTPNHKTTVSRVMNEKVSVREGEKTRRMTKFEAMLQAQTNKGMKGDSRSAVTVFNVMDKTGLLAEQDNATKANSAKSDANYTLDVDPGPGIVLFEGIDHKLLSRAEMIALAEYVELIGLRGFGGLSISDFERIKEITNKGRAKDGDTA
jgi:Family of unknown function (DUF5681)